jgi:cation:H+ antiporter
MVLFGLTALIGLVVLAVAPDRFVAGSAGLADRWGLSRVVIGAVVIGFGTSTPEMLVSGLAAGAGEPEIGVGNVIGSNVANLSLVLGVAALVGRVEVPRGLLRVELPLVVAATVGFAVAVQAGLSPVEGTALAAALVVALTIIVSRSRPLGGGGERELAAEVQEFLAAEEAAGPRRLAVDVFTGLVGTLVGAQLLVTGAVGLAEAAGISEGFIGMTVVAVGTSLPELVTAVAAARVGEDKLIVGNVVGSNLFNSLAVGAVIGFAGGRPLDDPALTVGGVALMLAITATAAIAMVHGSRVTRIEATVLLAAYAITLPLLAG